MIYNPNFPYNQQPMNNQFQNQPMISRNYMTPQETIFIPVHSDLEVINHPVAPGNSVYFKHETEPKIYIKSMGLSQFDTPKVIKYRLEEESLVVNANTTDNSAETKPKEQPKYVLFDDLKPTFDEIDRLHKEIAELREQIKATEVVEKVQPTSNRTTKSTSSTKEK